MNPRLQGAPVAEDELVRLLVDVELLLSLFRDLGKVRFRLLNHDHMEGTWDTAYNSASPRPRVPAEQREALQALKLFAALVGDDLLERPDPHSFAAASAAATSPPAQIRRAPGSLLGGLRVQEGA